MALRLDQHAAFVAELSGAASKEEGVERSLAGIAATWDGLALDMAEYKGAFKLRSTEDVFAALEDNGVTLSAMKASRWAAAFEADVARWERTLALASEALELVLQVQRAWMCECRRRAGALLLRCGRRLRLRRRLAAQPWTGLPAPTAAACRPRPALPTPQTWKTSSSAARTSADSCPRRAPCLRACTPRSRRAWPRCSASAT